MDTTPLTDNPQSHNPGDDRRTSSTASLEGQLLSCILKLMQPTISAHLNMPDEHIEPLFQKATASDEGNKLISALNDFVRVGVLAAMQQAGNASETPPLKSEAENTEPSLDGTDSSRESVNEEHQPVNELQLRIPPEVQLAELESMIQQQTRAHVYNNMPIRMLEFDADGSNIKLIGRDDILRILMPRVQVKTTSQEFLKDCNNAVESHKCTTMWCTIKAENLHEVVAKAISKAASYAILSHTWIRNSPGDVIFNTWSSRSRNERGWTKVKNFCRVAAHDHKMILGWVDSICINKDSSSELDESIRSMYKWYQGSHICITYLSETEALGDGAHDSWFTRGWTLQELLAPKNVAFYNQHWQPLGTDKENTIISLVTAETTITAWEIRTCRFGYKNHIPVSRILQMASQRQVTREEDSLYSLLGLLDVNISVAYGEGAKSAFRRLFQELLVTRKHVLDLFDRRYFYPERLIPSSLDKYSSRLDIVDEEYRRNWTNYQLPEPIVLTHLGLRCQWLLFPTLTVKRDTSDEIYVPKGQYSGQLTAIVTSKNRQDQNHVVRNLLDARLYDSESSYVHPLSDVLHIKSQRPTLLVPTFSLKGDALLLDEYLVGILAYAPDRPGEVHTGSDVEIISQGSPQCVKLVNSFGGSSWEIPIRDLELHGMQLVTLYL